MCIYVRWGGGVPRGCPVSSAQHPAAECCDHYFFNLPTPPTRPDLRQNFVMLQFHNKTWPDF